MDSQQGHLSSFHNTSTEIEDILSPVVRDVSEPKTHGLCSISKSGLPLLNVVVYDSRMDSYSILSHWMKSVGILVGSMNHWLRDRKHLDTIIAF